MLSFWTNPAPIGCCPRLPLDSNLTTTWLPLDYHFTTIWLPLEYQFVTTWMPHDYPLDYHSNINWLPLNISWVCRISPKRQHWVKWHFSTSASDIFLGFPTRSTTSLEWWYQTTQDPSVVLHLFIIKSTLNFCGGSNLKFYSTVSD